MNTWRLLEAKSKPNAALSNGMGPAGFVRAT